MFPAWIISPEILRTHSLCKSVVGYRLYMDFISEIYIKTVNSFKIYVKEAEFVRSGLPRIMFLFQFQLVS
jgi:hypothetical protein